MKILFVLCQKEEVSFFTSIWKELDCDIRAISWNLDEFTNIKDYKTRNIQDILKIEKPNLVVVGNDQCFLRRSFVYATQNLNIPTLLLRLGISSNVTHGYKIATKRTVYRLRYHFSEIIDKYRYLLRTMIGCRWSILKIIREILQDIKIYLTVDDNVGKYGCAMIAVSGEWGKKILQERGVKSPIEITGMFGIDVSGKAQLEVRENTILVLTSAYVEHGFWTVEQRDTLMKGIIEELNRFNLLFKIHPVENIKDYDYGVPVVQNYKACEIVNLCDVVICAGYSNVVLEACACRKPIILLNVFNEPEYIDYVGMGIVYPVKDLSKLHHAVCLMMKNSWERNDLMGNIDDFLLENKESFDGKASERLVQLILKTANS